MKYKTREHVGRKGYYQLYLTSGLLGFQLGWEELVITEMLNDKNKTVALHSSPSDNICVRNYLKNIKSFIDEN